MPGPGANKKRPFRAWGQMDSPQWNIDADHGSYGCNGWLSNPPAPSNGTPEPKNWRKLPRITNTSRVPFMVDAQWTDHWPEPQNPPPPTEDELWDVGPSLDYQMVRIVQNRHGKGIQNAIFMDGATRKIGLKEMWTFKWYQSFDTKGEWTKAGGATRAKWGGKAPWMAGFKDY